MQRVRIGIIGLASVFLLVLLAAALYSMFGERPSAPSAAETAALANGSEAPREPLAELGVAPGNAPPETNSAAVAPAHPAVDAARRAPKAVTAPSISGSSTPTH